MHAASLSENVGSKGRLQFTPSLLLKCWLGPPLQKEEGLGTSQLFIMKFTYFRYKNLVNVDFILF